MGGNCVKGEGIELPRSNVSVISLALSRSAVLKISQALIYYWWEYKMQRLWATVGSSSES